MCHYDFYAKRILPPCITILYFLAVITYENVAKKEITVSTSYLEMFFLNFNIFYKNESIDSQDSKILIKQLKIILLFIKSIQKLVEIIEFSKMSKGSQNSRGE